MSISPRYLSLQPSYYIDLNEGHEDQLFDHHHHHQVFHHNHTIPFSFSSLHPHSSSASSLSSSSSSSSPIYLNPVPDQVGFCYMGSHVQPYPYQQEVENLSSYEIGSYDQTALEIGKRANNGLKFSICKKDDHKSLDSAGGGGGEIDGSSVKWMSSKMRLMKKMMKTEEDQKAEADTGVGKFSNNGSNISENAAIRVCSDCNTTKTPLWRSGPRGPKSLCNACGIRQRKARRAMAAAAAAAAGNGSMVLNNPSNSTIRAGNTNKKTSTNNNNNNITGVGAQKKRTKILKLARDQQHKYNTSQRKLCFEEFALSLSKKLSLHQVFPQEEKEAAILLMAISCGLAH